VWCWGYNAGGQVGDGTTTNRSTPVRVGNATTWAVGATGGFHSCAASTNGSVWCWGYNWYGQLGDGTVIDKPAPVLASFAI
jgi:alpha-tubulin suppressor-like RCC1 family protein